MSNDTLEKIYTLAIIACVICCYLICKLIRRAFVRYTRMKMVSKHGWPPPHLDADGNAVELPETEKP